MAHIHVVTDSDAYFTIDPMTRAIRKEESSKTSLIVGDHNSERFSFELPRFIEGHDMSLCNVVRVHYMNTSSSKTELQSIGVYEVNDFGILATDDTKMGLSWLISNNATKYVGKLAFTVQFACMTGYRVDYSWQSGVYSSISISDGINGSEIVFDEYADILQQWWLKLYASSELPIKVLTSEEFAAIDGNTEHGTLYILEDDPTISTIANHTTKLVEHGAELTEHAAKITEHEQRIASVETDIENHTARLTDHDERLASVETDTENQATTLTQHTAKLGEHDEQLDDYRATSADYGQRIASAENNIRNNSDELKELTDTMHLLHDWTDYDLIVDMPNDVINRVTSGLWLFKVACGNGNFVSVFMDTECEYSAMFPISWTERATSLKYCHGALKRTNMDHATGLATIRLVKCILPTEDDNGFLKETLLDNEIIYGKRFRFLNSKD